ncbi:nuclear transport factor 2 family protein [Nocardioides acrostichi]|uniref:Nuclear transport factor 2 family protein n=1 Tax=Nocardioides acrostichi TaxID=2784339 RepID=A0A930V066_9ACTN|nr:nuclear transport factor 2 family protein [Nocardioides acrostichi]MBF4161295.1 nuclear transport factor 2 family protein [Nocardioides acrostichi]
MDIAEISDRLEIAEVLTRYTRAVDEHAWDRLDQVFTADAVIDYTASGGVHDAFPTVKAWLAEVLPMFFRRTMHMLGQIEITWTDAERSAADVVAYFDNPMTLDDGSGGTKVAHFGGFYRHAMVRTPEGWRSRRLVEDIVWKRGL